MAKTMYDLPPANAEFKSNAYPDFAASSDASGARRYLAFAPTGDEAAYWSFVVPQGAVAPYAAVLSIALATATSGNTNWDVAVEAITPGDAVDTDATESLAVVNVSGNVAVQSVAGYQQAITIPLTNNDDMQPGDRCRLRLRRILATSNAAGNAHLFGIELRESV